MHSEDEAVTCETDQDEEKVFIVIVEMAIPLLVSIFMNTVVMDYYR